MKDWYVELNKGPWRFKTTKKVSFFMGASVGNPKIIYEMYCGDRKWATLHSGWVTIESDYYSDGCTPGKRILGCWVGVPTFSYMLPAVMVHDVLTQFQDCAGVPWTDDQASEAFLYLMLNYKTPSFQAKSYYNVVRSGVGKAFRSASKSSPDSFIRQIALS